MSTFAPRSVSFALGLLAVGCTLNVQNVMRTATSDSPAAITTLRSDVRGIGFAMGSVDVRGADRTDAHAALTVAGLLPATGSATAIDDGISLTWDTSASPRMVLAVAYDGPASESLWLQSLGVDVPRACAVDLDADDPSVAVREVAAPVRVHTTSGDITVVGATSADLASEQGDIDVTADAATVTARSGGVRLDVLGEVHVTSRDGAVQGQLHDGGTITTTSGAIRVDLVGPLTRDLLLTADQGSIEVRVPSDASLSLDLASDSSIHVLVGSVTFDGTGSATRDLGAGGFRVVAHAASGSVRIERL